MAVYWSLCPIPTESAGGVTAMPINTAGVTVSAAVPGIFDDGSVAVMVIAPSATPVANPWALTVAVVGLDEDQVTLSVKFCVFRSEYVPVAVNCSL